MLDFVSMRGAKVEHSFGYVRLLQRSRCLKDTFAARRIILRCALVIPIPDTLHVVRRSLPYDRSTKHSRHPHHSSEGEPEDRFL